MRDIKPGQCHWHIWTTQTEIGSGVLKFKETSSINGRISGILNKVYAQVNQPLVCIYEVATEESISFYKIKRGNWPGGDDAETD